MNEDKEQDMVNEGGAGERDGVKVWQEDEGGIWRAVEEHRKKGWEEVGDGGERGIGCSVGCRSTRGWEGTWWVMEEHSMDGRDGTQLMTVHWKECGRRDGMGCEGSGGKQGGIGDGK